jgi:hypothetical protein
VPARNAIQNLWTVGERGKQAEAMADVCVWFGIYNGDCDSDGKGTMTIRVRSWPQQLEQLDG